MATESVKLIIGARDEASRVLAGVGGSLKQVKSDIVNVGKVSQSGGTEVGFLLASMRGTVVGDFAASLQSLAPVLDRFNLGITSAKIGSIALKAGLVGMVAVAGFKLGQFLSGASGKLAEFNSQLERSRELSAKVSEALGRQGAQQQFDLSLIKDPDQQRAKLEEMLESAQKNLGGVEGRSRAATAEFERMNTTLRSWTGNKLLALAKEEADQASVAVGEHRKKWQELQTQLNQFNQSEAARIQEERAAATKAKDQAIKGYLQSLRDEQDQLGLNSQELARYKAAKLGADESAQSQAALIQMEIDNRKKAIALQEEQATKQEALAKKEQAAFEALRATAKRIKDENRTALEEFVDDYKELMKLRVEGLIDPETFARATAKLKDSLADSAEDGSSGDVRKRAELQATESRFLTRGRGGGDVAKDQLSAARKTNDLMKQAEALIKTQTVHLEKIAANTSGGEEVFG